MRARLLSASGATILVAIAIAAALRVFERAPGMTHDTATVLGWLVLTAVAVAVIGLLAAIAATGTARSRRIARDLDPALQAELSHRRASLRSARHADRQRP